MTAKENNEQQVGGRRPYTPPIIIYRGKISTRAGSPVAIPDGSTSVVDPADLFGND